MTVIDYNALLNPGALPIDSQRTADIVPDPIMFGSIDPSVGPPPAPVKEPWYSGVYADGKINPNAIIAAGMLGSKMAGGTGIGDAGAIAANWAHMKAYQDAAGKQQANRNASNEDIGASLGNYTPKGEKGLLSKTETAEGITYKYDKEQTPVATNTPLESQREGLTGTSTPPAAPASTQPSGVEPVGGGGTVPAPAAPVAPVPGGRDLRDFFGGLLS